MDKITIIPKESKIILHCLCYTNDRSSSVPSVFIPTLTPTSTKKITPTPTKSVTPTKTVTSTLKTKITPTPTKTTTPTKSITPTKTATPTKSITLTPTKSATPTVTPTKKTNTISQPLFDKSSWLSVPEPYLSYLNEAADKWGRYIKYNSSVYQYIQSDYAKNNKTWNGLALDLTKFSFFNDSSSKTIARCGPVLGYDLDNNNGIKYNSATFQLSINEYYSTIYSSKDWVGHMTHELGHALGIGIFWDPKEISKTDGVSPINNLLDGNIYINAKNAYNSITSLTRTKIPLSFGDGHWAEEYKFPLGGELFYYGFSNELMVPSTYPGKISIISLLSIKTLVDFGYEEVSPGTSEGVPRIVQSPIISFSIMDNTQIITMNCTCEHKPIIKKIIK